MKLEQSISETPATSSDCPNNPRRDKYVTKMTGADVEHSAQIKFHGVILHAIDARDVVASRVVANK